MSDNESSEGRHTPLDIRPPGLGLNRYRLDTPDPPPVQYREITLSRYITKAKHLLDMAETSGGHVNELFALFKLTLSGLEEDGTRSQLVVDDLRAISNDYAIKQVRDYDSLVGLVRVLKISNCSLWLLPRLGTIEKDLGIRIGDDPPVKLTAVPHIHIADMPNGRIFIALPSLLDENNLSRAPPIAAQTQDALTELWLQHLLRSNAVRPTAVAASSTAERIRALKLRGQRDLQSVSVDSTCLAAVSQGVVTSLDGTEFGRGAFFIVDMSNLKELTRHNVGADYDSDEENDAWNNLTQNLEYSDEEMLGDEQKWYVDVGLQLSVDWDDYGGVVAWNTGSHTDVLRWGLSVNQDWAEACQRNRSIFFLDPLCGLDQVGGFRCILGDKEIVSPRNPHALPAKYFQLYDTTKNAHATRSRVLRGQPIVPKTQVKAMVKPHGGDGQASPEYEAAQNQFRNRAAIIKECIDTLHEGEARCEVRISLLEARGRDMVLWQMGMPQHLVTQSVMIFKGARFWNFMKTRIEIMRRLCQYLCTEIPPRLKQTRSVWTLLATVVHLANEIFKTPDVRSEVSRNIIHVIDGLTTDPDGELERTLSEVRGLHFFKPGVLVFGLQECQAIWLRHDLSLPDDELSTYFDLDFNTLRESLAKDDVNTAKRPKGRSIPIRTNRRAITTLAEDDDIPDLAAFATLQLGPVAPPNLTRFGGRESPVPPGAVNEEEEEEEEEEGGRFTADLNKYFHSMPIQIAQKFGKTYTKATYTDVEPANFFKDPRDIQKIFTSYQLVVASSQQEFLDHVHKFFPGLEYCAKTRSLDRTSIQGFPTMTYWLRWRELVERTTADQNKAIQTELRRLTADWKWIFYSSAWKMFDYKRLTYVQFCHPPNAEKLVRIMLGPGVAIPGHIDE